MFPSYLIKFFYISFTKENESDNRHCVKRVHIRSYSVPMRENADQNNSEYGLFLRSENVLSQLKNDP